MSIKGQRTAAGEETYKDILNAVLTLLGRGGPEAVSAGALAREANVSKATIFHHFESVDKILLAAFNWRQSWELEGHQPPSAHAYLDGLGQQLVRAAQDDPVLLKAQAAFITRAIFDRDMNARLAEGVSDMHRLVVEALRTRLSLSISLGEIETIARLAEMALDGLMINLVMRTDEWAQLQHTWTRMVDLLLARVGSAQ
ncbi:MAG: helix-turn-helix domain-containing protein [Edaphobacter sp.]